VEGLRRQGGQHIGHGGGLEHLTLHCLPLQHQLLQAVDLLLHRVLLGQVGADLLAQGADLGLGIGADPRHAGELAIHQLAADQVLGLQRQHQGGCRYSGQRQQQGQGSKTRRGTHHRGVNVS